MFGRERIEYKTPDQVRMMRRAGLVVADALATIRDAMRPGLTTADLDTLAADVIAGAGATPSFLGYGGFPATICVSVNDEIVHGIPGRRRIQEGDIVSVDCGAIVEGWHGDAAFSMVVPDADPADLALVEATRKSMWDGIAAIGAAVRPGLPARVGVIGDAVEASLIASGQADGVEYGIVEDYTGHGIGSAMHQPPDVFNFSTRERGPRLRPGMCVAVEPMVTRGSAENRVLGDEWTTVTVDGSRAAHWEHTVAIRPAGIWVLTASDGGAEELARRNVQIAPLD